MTILRLALAVFLAAVSPAGFAQEADDASRFRNIQEEVAKRRKLLEVAIGERGIVFAPFKHDDAWYAAPRNLVIDNAALATCGQVFANYARKEVMISGRVIQRRLTLSVPNVSGEKGLALLRSLIEGQGIAIVSVGSRSLALVDLAEMAK